MRCVGPKLREDVHIHVAMQINILMLCGMSGWVDLEKICMTFCCHEKLKHNRMCCVHNISSTYLIPWKQLSHECIIEEATQSCFQSFFHKIFIHINVSFYMLMIHKWSKIRA